MKKYQTLSGAVLKHIALVSMFLDHFHKAILLPLLIDSSADSLWFINDILSILGRFAFPLFAFLLVEGFHHTGSKLRYLGNLLLFALISEIPFNLFTVGTLDCAYAQNIFFTLALGFAVMWAIEETRNKVKHWLPPALLYVIAGCIIATLGNFDYHASGILVIVILYLFREKTLLASILGFLPLLKTYGALPAFLLTNFYNGQRGRQYKWLNYWFYPVHLAILGVISYFIP